MKKELHAITTGKQPIADMIKIARDIHPYVDWIHIREKQLPIEELFSIVQSLKETGVPLSKVILNGNASVAVATGASGIQLSSNGEDVSFVKKHFPMVRVGCSVHSLREALEKEEKGADFVIYGHVFETASKPGLRPRGLLALHEISSYVSIPVIAIGGITPFNVMDVLSAGAGGVAVLSGIFGATDPLNAAKKYRKEIEEATR